MIMEYADKKKLEFKFNRDDPINYRLIQPTRDHLLLLSFSLAMTLMMLVYHLQISFHLPTNDDDDHSLLLLMVDVYCCCYWSCCLQLLQ
jgi:hypothetical protein